VFETDIREISPPDLTQRELALIIRAARRRYGPTTDLRPSPGPPTRPVDVAAAETGAPPPRAPQDGLGSRGAPPAERP